MKIDPYSSVLDMVEALSDGYTPSKEPLLLMLNEIGYEAALYYGWLDDCNISGKKIYDLYVEYDKNINNFMVDIKHNRYKLVMV